MMKGKHMKLTVNVINFFLTCDSFQSKFLINQEGGREGGLSRLEDWHQGGWHQEHRRRTVFLNNRFSV